MSSSDETTTGTGDAMRLLESLTPGGSEYYENPQRCAAWVQERLDSAQRLTVRAYTERNEMRQENARLRERVAALEKMAEYGQHDPGCYAMHSRLGEAAACKCGFYEARIVWAALAQADDGGRA